MNLRQQRINKQLQRDLAHIIRSQGMAHYDGAMLSVTEVIVSPNMATAKVYVSIFPSSKTEAALHALNAKGLRSMLAQRFGKQMRVVPELTFIVDESLNYAARIEELLKENNINNSNS
jgi:ribosome-binding factor A